MTDSLFDPADLPAHWSSKRLRFLTSINREQLPPNTPPETPLRYMDISSVGGDGSLREPQAMPFENAPSRARRLAREGDTAVSTVRTYLKAIALVDPGHGDCVWSTGFAILSPGPELDPKFLYYVTRSTQFVSEIERRSVGISYPAVNTEDMADILCPLPPLEEQRRIAGFLDREVRRLEALEQSHRRAALLARERTEEAILARVVPASAEWAPGHPLSGMPLTTSIEGWKPIRLKFTVEGAVNGVWGDEATGGPEDVCCVRVADFDYSRGRVKSAPTLRAVPEQTRQQKALRPGDLLLEKSGGGEQQPVGRVVLWDLPLDDLVVCSNFIARMRPRAGFDGGYLQLLHRALYSSGVTSLSIKQTTGIQNLDSHHYLSHTVSIPEPREQVRIREELGELVEAEQSLSRESARQTELLGEHRDALVSAAVTGAVDSSAQPASAVAA